MLQPKDQSTKHYNRKTTKLDYLNREIQQLKDHIQNLEYQQKLNKAQLAIALQIPQQDQSSSKIRQNQPSVSTQNFNQQQPQFDQNNPQLQDLIYALQDENSALLNELKQIQQERDESQGRNLVMEQMYESAEKQKKELIEDLTNNQKRLQTKLKDQDIKIHELEKAHVDVDELTGVVIQYRDVVSFNDQTKCLHFELEKLNAFISAQNKELKFFKEQRENILKINVTLNQELVKQRQLIKALQQRNSQQYQSTTDFTSPLLKQTFLSSDRQNFEQNQQQLFPNYVDPDQDQDSSQPSKDMPKISGGIPNTLSSNNKNKSEEQPQLLETNQNEEEDEDEEDYPYLEVKVKNPTSKPAFVVQLEEQQKQQDLQLQKQQKQEEQIKKLQLNLENNKEKKTKDMSISIPQLKSKSQQEFQNDQEKLKQFEESTDIEGYSVGKKKHRQSKSVVISPLKPMQPAQLNQSAKKNNSSDNIELQEDQQANSKQVKDMIKFVEQLRKNEDDSEKGSNDSYEENLPDKVQYHNTQQDEKEDKSPQVKQQAVSLIKPLNLAKAKEIQKKTVDKQMQQEAQKFISQGGGINLQPYIDRIYKLDQRLERAGRNMAKELLKNKNLAKENEDLIRINTELEQRNNTLISSQKIYEEKWQRFFKQYQLFEDFYRRYKGLAQNQDGLEDLPSHHLTPMESIPNPQNESAFINYNLPTNETNMNNIPPYQQQFDPQQQQQYYDQNQQQGQYFDPQQQQQYNGQMPNFYPPQDQYVDQQQMPPLQGEQYIQDPQQQQYYPEQQQFYEQQPVFNQDQQQQGQFIDKQQQNDQQQQYQEGTDDQQQQQQNIPNNQQQQQIQQQKQITMVPVLQIPVKNGQQEEQEQQQEEE